MKRATHLRKALTNAMMPDTTYPARFAIVSPQTLAQRAVEKSMGTSLPTRIRMGSLTMKRWKSEHAHERRSSVPVALFYEAKK